EPHAPTPHANRQEDAPSRAQSSRSLNSCGARQRTSSSRLPQPTSSDARISPPGAAVRTQAQQRAVRNALVRRASYRRLLIVVRNCHSGCWLRLDDICGGELLDASIRIRLSFTSFEISGRLQFMAESRERTSLRNKFSRIDMLTLKKLVAIL